jgi:glyoxylase-like metal-dependent hydrolase (beta-lactamase superfamily II)
MNDKNEETAFKNFIEKNSLQMKYLFNTHCHIEHILGNHFVKSNYDVKFYAPKDDLFLLELMNEQAKMFDIKIKKSPKPDYFITEDLQLNFGEQNLNFIFTPGHTPGEFSIYNQTEKILFSGDVLFKESIGRTDLWGGNYSQLIDSIKTKIFSLDDDTKVYPGHESETTIAHEKKYNQFLI